MGGKEGGLGTQLHGFHGRGDVPAACLMMPSTVIGGMVFCLSFLARLNFFLFFFFLVLINFLFFSVPFLSITQSFLYLTDLRSLLWKSQLPALSRFANGTSSPSLELVSSFC